MKSEYQVDGAISKVGGQNESIAKLDVLMQYNYELWHTHYLMHLHQLELLRNVGDFAEMSKSEWMKLNPGIGQYQIAETECANFYPTVNQLAHNAGTRVVTQFAWGCS